MTPNKTCIVIGGGAAGLVTALLLAERGVRVTVLEKNLVTGKKLSMTGNGRCNLSNTSISAACYNPEARALMETLLSRFDTSVITTFFEGIGLPLREEDGGLYPVSGEAASVQRALHEAVLRAGVSIKTQIQVKKVERAKEGHFVVITDSGTYEAETVVLASGGLAGPKSCLATGDGYYMAERLGIQVTPRYPALTGLCSEDVSLPVKTGVRSYARADLWAGECPFEKSLTRSPEAAGYVKVTSEIGEVQLTNGILSGFPVMQLSRHVPVLLEKGRRLVLTLNLFPEWDDEAFEALIQKRIDKVFSAPVCEQADSVLRMEEFLTGFAPKALQDMVLMRAGFSREEEVTAHTKESLTALLRMYRQLSFRLTSVCDYTRAQVTSGGIACSALTGDMESKEVPGFFAVGEVVDADGRCGGYNLHFAFMSAMAAAERIGSL